VDAYCAWKLWQNLTLYKQNQNWICTDTYISFKQNLWIACRLSHVGVMSLYKETVFSVYPIIHLSWFYNSVWNYLTCIRVNWYSWAIWRLSLASSRKGIECHLCVKRRTMLDIYETTYYCIHLHIGCPYLPIFLVYKFGIFLTLWKKILTCSSSESLKYPPGSNSVTLQVVAAHSSEMLEQTYHPT
jgi:hypothetical protein